MFAEFIKELNEKKIEIAYSKGKIKYSGPKENIDSELISKLKKFKPDLLKHFWPKECWNMMPINTHGDKTPLIYLHGGPANYSISEYLGKDRPFYGFFYIGSEGEKIKYKTLEDFADEYMRQLQYILPEGPFILGGSSIGGNLAYHIAVKLQEQGHQVPLLIIVDSVLPAIDKNLGFKFCLKNFYTQNRDNFKIVYNFFRDTSDKIKYAILTRMYKKLPDTKRNKYIIWRYGQLLSKYKPEGEFKGQMLLFKAEETDSIFNNMGWEKVCKRIKKVNFDGDHGAMYHSKDSIGFIKKEIKNAIQEIENSDKDLIPEHEKKTMLAF